MPPSTVWIVGAPEDGSRARRYHLGGCYVLDQVGNYDHKRKALLAGLPEGYAPCQICAPGARSPTSASSSKSTGEKPQGPNGIQPGAVVHVEDLDTGLVSEHRIASAGLSGVSPDSPLGAALIGRVTGEVVEFQPPKGGSRKLRIRRFVAG